MRRCWICELPFADREVGWQVASVPGRLVHERCIQETIVPARFAPGELLEMVEERGRELGESFKVVQG